MTTVFQARQGPGFERCHPVRSEDQETVDQLVATAGWWPAWHPIPVRLVRDGGGRPADSPWWGPHVLVLRESARERIALELAGNGPCLPLDCAEAQLVLFHTPRFLDILDGDRPDGRYRFRDAPADDVFRVPGLRVSPIFVTDRFVAAWEAARITGVTFEPIWSDAAGY